LTRPRGAGREPLVRCWHLGQPQHGVTVPGQGGANRAEEHDEVLGNINDAGGPRRSLTPSGARVVTGGLLGDGPINAKAVAPRIVS
jgi:hypothetical protein